MKHNVLTQRRKLRVSVEEQEGMVLFRNNLQPKQSLQSTTHIGLENLTRRYEYLCGTSLRVARDDHFFTVFLPIIRPPMTVLILEDEAITAEELRHYVRDVDPTIEVLAMLETVEDAVHFLTTHGSPDLIFSDIQLADGLSFEVFERVPVRCPVIFCTAFDEYALQAFATNGIDYVLKPFDRKTIASSLTKFRTLQTAFQRDTPATTPPNVNESLRQLVAQLRPTHRSSFLVNHKGKYYPVPVGEIAFFYTENEIVWLHKSSGEKYALDHKLDQLETLLDPTQFYRANRQFIIRYDAIQEFEPYFNRKLTVRLHPAPPEPVIISKAKAGDFMRWLEQR